MRAVKKIRNVLETAGCSPVEMTTDEVASWQQRWRELFAKELHAATGEWVFADFDWHVFSFEHHASKTGDDARSEYRRREPCRFVVLSALAYDSFGFTCEGKPPDRLKAGVDILVFPISLAWTMAFTHEEPTIGPYFARP